MCFLRPILSPVGAARRRALTSPGVRALHPRFRDRSARDRRRASRSRPEQALAALGFSDPAPSTIVVARLAGGRDIAMGLATLHARRDADASAPRA